MPVAIGGWRIEDPMRSKAYGQYSSPWSLRTALAQATQALNKTAHPKLAWAICLAAPEAEA